MIGAVLPHPSRFSFCYDYKIARSISGLIPKRLRNVNAGAVAPSSSPLGSGPVIWPAEGVERVLLMQGCVQQVLAARINEATVVTDTSGLRRCCQRLRLLRCYRAS